MCPFQTTCQDTDLGAAGDNDEDDGEAEQDELLLECAGDVIPKFGNAIVPDDFFLYFPNVLQLLSVRTVIFLILSKKRTKYDLIC